MGEIYSAVPREIEKIDPTEVDRHREEVDEQELEEIDDRFRGEDPERDWSIGAEDLSVDEFAEGGGDISDKRAAEAEAAGDCQAELEEYYERTDMSTGFLREEQERAYWENYEEVNGLPRSDEREE